MIELYYGVSLPPGCESREEVDLRPVYTDQVEVLKVLKVYKEARFKVFRSEEEARQFSLRPLEYQACSTMARAPFSPPAPSVAYPHHLDEDPETDPAFHFEMDSEPDLTFHSDADPDPDPTTAFSPELDPPVL